MKNKEETNSKDSRKEHGRARKEPGEMQPGRMWSAFFRGPQSSAREKEANWGGANTKKVLNRTYRAKTHIWNSFNKI